MALRITVDMFSGRSNPSREINDPDQIEELEERLARNPDACGEVGSGYSGLGFDGLRVDFTEGSGTTGLPVSFELAGGGAKDSIASAELAHVLVETIPRDLSEGRGIAVGDSRYAEAMLETTHEEIRRNMRKQSPGGAYASPGVQQEADVPEEMKEQLRALADRTPTCGVDSEPWAPYYWNDDTIRPLNNCYAYGVAYRSDTFAYPGRKHGYEIPDTMLGFQVAVGLYKDGLTMFGYPCQPPGNRRFLVALFTGVYPQTGVRDFHFYRYRVEGFWSHKHAGNSARFVDESGFVIRDPGVCDRGIYNESFGLFQSHDSVTIR